MVPRPTKTQQRAAKWQVPMGLLTVLPLTADTLWSSVIVSSIICIWMVPMPREASYYHQVPQYCCTLWARGQWSLVGEGGQVGGELSCLLHDPFLLPLLKFRSINGGRSTAGMCNRIEAYEKLSRCQGIIKKSAGIF